MPGEDLFQVVLNFLEHDRGLVGRRDNGEAQEQLSVEFYHSVLAGGEEQNLIRSLRKVVSDVAKRSRLP